MNLCNADKMKSEYRVESFSSAGVSPVPASYISSQASPHNCEEEPFYELLSDTCSSFSQAQPQCVNQSHNLYVASLPHDFTDAELYALFSPFGPIVSTKTMCKKNVGHESKGYGFVLFEKEEDAIVAQRNMIGYVVRGSKIQVRRAKDSQSSSGLSHASSVRSQDKGPLPDFSTALLPLSSAQSSSLSTGPIASSPSFRLCEVENRIGGDLSTPQANSFSPIPFTFVPGQVAMPIVSPVVMVPNSQVFYGNPVPSSSPAVMYPIVGSDAVHVPVQPVQFIPAPMW